MTNWVSLREQTFPFISMLHIHLRMTYIAKNVYHELEIRHIFMLKGKSHSFLRATSTVKKMKEIRTRKKWNTNDCDSNLENSIIFVVNYVCFQYFFRRKFKIKFYLKFLYLSLCYTKQQAIDLIACIPFIW